MLLLSLYFSIRKSSVIRSPLDSPLRLPVIDAFLSQNSCFKFFLCEESDFFSVFESKNEMIFLGRHLSVLSLFFSSDALAKLEQPTLSHVHVRLITPVVKTN